MNALIRRILLRIPQLKRLQRLSLQLEQSSRNQGLLASRIAGVPEIDATLLPQDDVLGTQSCLCRERDFHFPSYHRWCGYLGESPKYHRKQWEFVAIAAAFENAGLLRSEARILGLGVGTEPLPALFASYDMTVVATDQTNEAAQAQGWIDTNQHASGLAELSRPNVISDEQLAQRVHFQILDMNQLPDDLGDFDAVWSACSIEHLGSIEQTLNCMVDVMRYLKPGGIAVHTTEFNLSSNEDTLEEGPTVLLRERDIKELASRLAHVGCELEPLSLIQGDGFLDNYVDIPPYQLDAHLRLLIESFRSTSVMLIIRKGGEDVEI